jgi:hypothetical protein
MAHCLIGLGKARHFIRHSNCTITTNIIYYNKPPLSHLVQLLAQPPLLLEPEGEGEGEPKVTPKVRQRRCVVIVQLECPI